MVTRIKKPFIYNHVKSVGVSTVHAFLTGEVPVEGNSLMEQLRGEALKFHKPGNQPVLPSL